MYLCPTGGHPIEIYFIRKFESSGNHVTLTVWWRLYPFWQTPTCGRQTDKYAAIISYTTLAQCHVVKMHAINYHCQHQQLQCNLTTLIMTPVSVTYITALNSHYGNENALQQCNSHMDFNVILIGFYVCTLLINVKATRWGYSWSEIRTAAKESPRTYTWHM